MFRCNLLITNTNHYYISTLSIWVILYTKMAQITSSILTTSFAQLTTNKVLLIEWAWGTTNPGFGFYDHKISKTFLLIYRTTDIVCIFLNAFFTHWSDSHKPWQEMTGSYLTSRLNKYIYIYIYIYLLILVFCIHKIKPTCTLLFNTF